MVVVGDWWSRCSQSESQRRDRGQWLRDRGGGGRWSWKPRVRDAKGVEVGVGGNRVVCHMDIRHVVIVYTQPVSRSSVWCRVG